MNASTLSLIFQSGSALALLLVIALVWRTDLRTDEFRQRLFIIRDELFDYAAHGQIAFEDPAYQLLRNSMNGFIRYAHRLTFFQLVLTIVRWSITEQVHPLTWHSRWTKSLESLPEGTRAAMEAFHGRAMDAVARHIVGGSIVRIVILACMLLKALIAGAWTSVRTLLRDAFERATTKVFDPRLLEEEASRA